MNSETLLQRLCCNFTQYPQFLYVSVSWKMLHSFLEELNCSYNKCTGAFVYHVFSSVVVKKVTNRHNRTLLVCYAASVHLLLKKRTTLPFVVRNKQRFESCYSNIFKFWPYNRFLCRLSLHGIVRNQYRVSQAYEMSVNKKRVHTKRRALPFVVRNEQRF